MGTIPPQSNAPTVSDSAICPYGRSQALASRPGGCRWIRLPALPHCQGPPSSELANPNVIVRGHALVRFTVTGGGIPSVRLRQRASVGMDFQKEWTFKKVPRRFSRLDRLDQDQHGSLIPFNARQPRGMAMAALTMTTSSDPPLRLACGRKH